MSTYADSSQEVRPFRIEVPQADLDDLHTRLAATRWAPDRGDTDWSRGTPQPYLRELADYWRTGYDWRAAEAELNQLPQFTTRIDGADIHFAHVRSPEPDAVPLIITPGWPGSLAEFLDVVGPLTDPAAHGGHPRRAFHLVIASMPGYGFSSLPEAGWGIPRVARAWLELMTRLGYERFAAQGGDWGSLVSLELGRIAPERVSAVHTTFMVALPSGDPEELSGLGPEDQARLGRLAEFGGDGSSYMKLLQTRPLTPSYGLNDSPAGLLAWIVEKFHEWTTPAASPQDVIDRDRLLTDVMLYWVTGAISSSAQMYYEVAETERSMAGPPAPVTVPIGVAVFPHDCIVAIRPLADRDHPSITHWREFDRGGHFPALEVPGYFVEDVRDFLDPTEAVAQPAG
jgi:pimeloyl-ACP methyl ester carboxylesterase